MQIRLTGNAAILSDHDLLSHHWDRLSESTRTSFNAPVAPGMRLRFDGSLPPGVEKDEISAFEGFCLVRVDLSTLERLDTSKAKHVRHHFVRTDWGWLGARRVP